ncbi:MAG TPA: hypothetical protein VF753_00420 [Terriglobales bacterium]
MRGHMAISLFALVFGALETGGAVQELVYRGILNSETQPMIVGALGTLTGAVLLWTGVALLIRSRQVSVLVPATVYLSLPTFYISGIHECSSCPHHHYAGWPITLVGIAFPLIMLLWYKWNTKQEVTP